MAALITPVHDPVHDPAPNQALDPALDPALDRAHDPAHDPAPDPDLALLSYLFAWSRRGVGKSLLLFTMCLKWSEATVHAYEYIPTTFDTFGTPVRVTVPGGPVALSITELGPGP